MIGTAQIAVKAAATVGLATALLATLAPSAGAAPLTGPPLAAGQYSTIKVPGGKNVMAEGISDSGTIVGCDEQKAGGRGFIEKNKKFAVLADPAAGAKGPTCALSINSQGVIVGEYGSTLLHGFVFNGTRFTTINEPRAGHKTGEGTEAVDLNDSGTIVGWYITSNHAERGFVLRNGKFTSINFPGHATAKDRNTILNGISDNGTLTGIFNDAAGDQISFTYHNGKFRPISVPQAKSTLIACISKHSGLIVGGYLVGKSKAFRGFTLRNGVYHTLQVPSGQASSAKKQTLPQCGNDHGAVVGFSSGTGNAALDSSGFLFTPGQGSASPGVLTSRPLRGTNPARTRGRF